MTTPNEEKAMKHSPLPWSIHPKASLAIQTELGDTVASCGASSRIEDQWHENAKLIVQAVNSHAPMLALLREIHDKATISPGYRKAIADLLAALDKDASGRLK